MKRITLIFFLILLAIPVCAESVRDRLLGGPKKVDSHPPLLLEVAIQAQILKQRPATEPYLPNRVYLYFLEAQKRWIWVLSDFEGKINEPIEGIRGLSVVTGSLVGAKNSAQRYLLDPKTALWRPTFEPEQQFFWIYSKDPVPEHCKVVSYSRPIKTTGGQK